MFHHFQKGDTFYDFLFPFLQTSPLLKRVLHYKKRIFAHRGKFFPFSVHPFAEGRQNDFDSVASPERVFFSPFRKHAYSNILKILPQKNEIFQIKNSDIFHISAQNIDCRYLLEPAR